MGSSLSYDNPSYFTPASSTWLTFAAIDPQLILKAPALINPINTGPIGLNAVAQGRPERLPQAVNFMVGQTIGSAQWMKAGSVQGFIGVDVAHTGQDRLIQEQRLELPAARPENVGQVCRAEGLAERFRAEVTKYGGGIHG